MREKKKKQGLARLLELAGARRKKLAAACLLSVCSSAARIVPFFTIYGAAAELLAHYAAPKEVDQGKILWLCAVTFGAALVYGGCAYASSSLSHRAAYEIIYELRLQLMEKLSRISPGYFTGTTQGAVKKTVSDDSGQLEVFLAQLLFLLPASLLLIPGKDGYQTVVGEGGSALSEEEKQRISIVRVLLKDALIVLLDDCEIIGLTRRNPIKSRALPC